MADSDLEAVVSELLRLDPAGIRVGNAIRETFDQLLDGQRTGRWDYRTLRKTEKTHMGTLIEISLHREFEFEDGTQMDYRIAGVEVDCKFSRSPRGWQIPLEAVGHLCLLVWANDEQGLWSAGVVRIEEGILRLAGNRDRKRTLNDEGVQAVHWLWRDESLPENLLLHLEQQTLAQIFAFPGKRKGQRRIDELFRLVQGRVISRTAVLTVGQQDDPPKRVRDSRRRLRPHGIIILGHQGDHPRVARTLGLPVPRKGTWVSAAVTAAGSSDAPRVSIGGYEYRLAAPGEPVQPAPKLDARLQEDE